MRYIIYDGRYQLDPDSAQILEVCTTLHEAEEAVKNYGDAVIVAQQSSESTTGEKE